MRLKTMSLPVARRVGTGDPGSAEVSTRADHRSVPCGARPAQPNSTSFRECFVVAQSLSVDARPHQVRNTTESRAEHGILFRSPDGI